MNKQALEQALLGFGKARVALIGDFCLDLYEIADMRLSELSRETPLFPYPIVEERFSAGGAGNVAANMASLGPEKLTAIGLTGQDWREGLLRQALEKAGVPTESLVQIPGLVTNTYLKTLRKGISSVVYEAPRLDFENRKPTPPAEEQALLEKLEQGDFQVLAVSDQLGFGAITPRVRERILSLAREGKQVLVDSRDRIDLYPGCLVKPNEIEALRAFGEPGESLPEHRQELPEFALKLLPRVVEKTGAPAVITLGDQGCVYWEGEPRYCPACRVEGETDISGAGDTFLAALTVALSSGLSLGEAVSIAGMASAVTVKKIGITGTASPGEILKLAETGGFRE